MIFQGFVVFRDDKNGRNIFKAIVFEIVHRVA
jgi:hypothetical protein